MNRTYEPTGRNPLPPDYFGRVCLRGLYSQSYILTRHAPRYIPIGFMEADMGESTVPQASDTLCPGQRGLTVDDSVGHKLKPTKKKEKKNHILDSHMATQKKKEKKPSQIDRSGWSPVKPDHNPPPPPGQRLLLGSFDRILNKQPRCRKCMGTVVLQGSYM